MFLILSSQSRLIVLALAWNLTLAGMYAASAAFILLPVQ